MAVSVNVSESPVAIGPIGTSQQVRNLTATVLVNGVLTNVLMQVVGLSDQNGNLIDMNITKRQDIELQLLVDIRRELLIQNEMIAQMLSGAPLFVPPIDLDKEYRRDPAFDYALP